jgi:HK97 gp10 family phage protein
MNKLSVTVVRRKNRSAKVLQQYTSQLQQVVARGANMVRNTAVESIHAHNSTGRTYRKYNPNRIHVASLEGYLASNVHVVIDPDRLGASVESRAEYSAHLEFGTSKMGARPFLQPALEENKPKIRALYKKLRAR